MERKHPFWQPMLCLFLFALLLMAVAIGCDDSGDDDDDNDDDNDDGYPHFDDPIEEGRYYLKVGVPVRAGMAFDRALAEDPENGEAHYGSMLSGDMELFALISLISNYLADPADGDDLDVKFTDPSRDSIQKIVDAMADDSIGPASDRIVNSGVWLQNNGDPEFLIDGIPVFLCNEVVAELGEEFDVSERTASVAFGHLFGALGRTIASLDVDFNIQILMTLTEVNFDDYSTMETVSLIVEMVNRLINDPGYPNFLRLDTDRVDDLFKARRNVGLGLVELMNVLNAIESETDDQADDVLAYDDADESGDYTEGEFYVIPGVGVVDQQVMDILFGVSIMGADLGAAFLDRTELDLHPDVDDPFDLAVLNYVLEPLGAPPMIPQGIDIDVAGVCEDLNPDSVVNLLQRIVDLLQPFLPDPPDVF